jgi:hypothetical protein
VRFVVGRQGRYGAGHAWVSLRRDDKVYVVEPLCPRVKLPRLETLRYRPYVSVDASGGQVKYFEHAPKRGEPPFTVLMALLPEWLVFQARITCLRLGRMCAALVRRSGGK